MEMKSENGENGEGRWWEEKNGRDGAVKALSPDFRSVHKVCGATEGIRTLVQTISVFDKFSPSKQLFISRKVS